MPVKVPDASPLSALAFGEDEAPYVRDIIRGAELWAPTLLVYELTNAA